MLRLVMLHQLGGASATTMQLTPTHMLASMRTESLHWVRENGRASGKQPARSQHSHQCEKKRSFCSTSMLGTLNAMTS